MELLILVLAGLVGFLVLVQLGTMREVVVLRSQLASFSQLVMQPPEPSWLETGRVPAQLREQHTQLAASDDECLAFVFVESGCPSCRVLVAECAAERSADLAARVAFVVLDKPHNSDEAPGINETLTENGFRYIRDPDSSLLHAAGVHGTPTAVLVTHNTAVAYKAGVDLQWLMKQLSEAYV